MRESDDGLFRVVSPLKTMLRRSDNKELAVLEVIGKGCEGDTLPGSPGSA